MQAHDITARQRQILKAVIHDHITSGEPVGSRSIARRYLSDLSAATIRNVMADLEEMGYLTQPHTSAGRVPTDLGYRYYVDTLPPAGRVLPQDRALIDTSLRELGGEFSEAMEAVPRLLSRLTRQVAY